jgi:hypothetical protein
LENQDTKSFPQDREIRFANSNRARLTTCKKGADPSEILKSLEIGQPGALILVLGGENNITDSLKPRLTQLFSRGIANAAMTTDALIIDSGTDTGANVLMGQGVADRGRKSDLLGIAPAGKVSLPDEPQPNKKGDRALLNSNHSHFILVDCNQWGEESEMRFEIAKTLGEDIPVVAILVNGAETAKEEMLQCVRRGWPVIVIEGSEGSADEFAALWKKKPAFINDPVSAEIIADGNIQLFPIDGSVASLERLIVRELGGNASLRLAWETFALYDLNAVRQQKSFTQMQTGMLILAVVGTFLAITQTQFKLGEAYLVDTLRWFSPESFNYFIEVFKYLIILVPITVSVIMAAANRFKAGHKWILLRSSAESIKREIYRYRARAGLYSDPRTRQVNREVKLARKLKNITRQLMQTEANLAGLKPYAGPIPPQYGAAPDDNGMGFLSSDQYLKFRLIDQLDYYRGKVQKLDKKSTRFQWYIYLVGGLGTLLAALGLEIWIALTTALAGVFTTYLEFKQIEKTVMNYNQAATDLANIHSWWIALPADEQTNPANIDKLVEGTESTLQREYTGWVEHMQEMLEALQEEQETKEAEEQEAGGQ